MPRGHFLLSSHKRKQKEPRGAPRCRSAVQKCSFAPFSNKRKGVGPRGLSASPFPASRLIAANENEVAPAKLCAFFFFAN